MVVGEGLRPRFARFVYVEGFPKWMIWVGTLCWAGCWVRGWPVGTERTAEVGREGRGCTTPPSPCCLPSWRSDPTKYAGRGGAGHCSILCPRSLATWPRCHTSLQWWRMSTPCRHIFVTGKCTVYLLYQTVGIICCGDRIPFLWKDHDFKEDFLHRLTKDNTIG